MAHVANICSVECTGLVPRLLKIKKFAGIFKPDPEEQVQISPDQLMSMCRLPMRMGLSGQCEEMADCVTQHADDALLLQCISAWLFSS